MAVPLREGVVFRIMRKQTYEFKLEPVLQTDLFFKKEGTTDEVIMKNEKEFNKKLFLRNEIPLLEQLTVSQFMFSMSSILFIQNCSSL